MIVIVVVHGGGMKIVHTMGHEGMVGVMIGRYIDSSAYSSTPTMQYQHCHDYRCLLQHYITHTIGIELGQCGFVLLRRLCQLHHPL